MTVGLGGVCFIVAVILFILAAVPFREGAYGGRLTSVGLAFFAMGHLLQVAIVVAVAAVLVMAMPATAYAETFEWDPGPPKGVVGHDGIACYGEASQDGHTVKLTNYVGYDAGQSEASERAWQQAECRSMMESHIALVFLWKWNVQLSPSTPIKISTRAL